MKEGWEIKKLGELCEVITKGTTPTSLGFNFTEEGVNFIKVESLTEIGEIIPNKVAHISMECHESMKRSQLKENDILFSIAGALGRIGIVKKEIIPANTNQALAIIRLEKKSDILVSFLAKYFTSNIISEEITKLQGGAAQQNLSLSQLSNLSIPIPPLSEQKRIVAILDEVSEKISVAKSSAEQNLKNARELFESYLQSLFENPKDNWEKKKWGDLCHFVRGPFGGSLKKSIFKEEGYVVYEQKHAIHDHFNQLRYFIDEDKFKEMIRFELKPGDIIMSCSGVTLGRVAIVPNDIKRGIINQALLKLTPKKNVSVHFIKHWLRSRIFQKIIFDYSGGAAIPNVPSAKILKDILIPFPSLKEQERVVNDIELVLVETQKLEAIYQTKINDSEELKKSVLQKAFRGVLNIN